MDAPLAEARATLLDRDLPNRLGGPGTMAHALNAGIGGADTGIAGMHQDQTTQEQNCLASKRAAESPESYYGLVLMQLMRTCHVTSSDLLPPLWARIAGNPKYTRIVVVRAMNQAKLDSDLHSGSGFVSPALNSAVKAGQLFGLDLKTLNSGWTIYALLTGNRETRVEYEGVHRDLDTTSQTVVGLTLRKTQEATKKLKIVPITTVSRLITVLKQFSHQADALLGDMYILRLYRQFMLDLEQDTETLEHLLTSDPVICMRIIHAVDTYWYRFLSKQWEQATLITSGYDFSQSIWEPIQFGNWHPMLLPPTLRAWGMQQVARSNSGALDPAPPRQAPAPAPAPAPGGARPPPACPPQAPGNTRVLLQANQQVPGISINADAAIRQLRVDRAAAAPPVQTLG